MRALSSLLLAGAVGFGGLALAPATARADGGWRGRDHYRSYVPPPQRYYGYGYGGGHGYRPRAYYRPPPPVYYRPPVFYRPPPSAFYAPPPAFFGAPRSYGIPPGPGVGLWIR
jgi:hypothetical protein